MGDTRPDEDIAHALECMCNRPIIIYNELRGVAVAGLPAELATAPVVNEMLQSYNGALYVGIGMKAAAGAGLVRQPSANGGPQHLFVPVDGELTTTGIAAADRAETINELVKMGEDAWQLAMPGHVTPIEYNEAGILGRFGIVEALHDLAVAAGYSGKAAFIGVLGARGSAESEIKALAQHVDVPVLTLARVLRWRREVCGWSETAPRNPLVLPYRQTTVHVNSRQPCRRMSEMAVYVTWICLQGHVWQVEDDPCGRRMRRVLEEMHDNSGDGAVAVVLDAAGPSPTCPGGEERRELEAIAGLIAAEFAAAKPRRFAADAPWEPARLR